MKKIQATLNNIAAESGESGWRSADGRLTPWDKLEDEHLENIWLMLERNLRGIKITNRLDVSWSNDRTALMMTMVETERERRRVAGVSILRRERRATCGACGCDRVINGRVAQFAARPEEPTDLFYCGCQDDDDMSETEILGVVGDNS